MRVHNSVNIARQNGLTCVSVGRALSREGKKILHVDKNAYYGGSEAALSLQDAHDWADSVGKGLSTFLNGALAGC